MSGDVSAHQVWATEIYPPASYSPWWWVVVAVCLLGIVGVIWWARRSLRTVSPTTTREDLVERLRGQTLAQIDRIAASVASGKVTTADGAALLSAEVRRFAGTVTNGNADYLVLPELRREAARDLRLAPVVEVVESAEDAAFAPGRRDGVLDLLADRAREVVRGWT